MHPHIGVVVTGKDALKDFQIFLKTLEVWHPEAQVYVFTDSVTDLSNVKFSSSKGSLHIRYAMDAYCGKSRHEMEASSGKYYKSLFTDYTYEKVNVLQWIFDTVDTPDGVWFMDSDITLLAPLPTIPSSASLALSPHYIRLTDERMFGKYNAGFMWFRDKRYLKEWKDAGHTTRFYEQAPLEIIAGSAEDELYEFPIQVNFGWWRMFQSALPPPEIQSKFSIFRSEQGIGLRYDGKPLQSIHTHWFQKDTSSTTAFNIWIMNYLKPFEKHKPIQRFRKLIQDSVVA
jgi:hypothetical protein